VQQLETPHFERVETHDIPGPRGRAAVRGRLGRLDYLGLVGLLAAVGLFLYCYGIGETELFINNDETRHAFTGVFLRDCMVDFPVTHPVSYAEEYYEQYPAVSIFRWSPFFYLVEGALFLLFGISVAVAKLSVVLFAAVFILYFYRLLRDHFGRGVACGATLLAIAAPQMIYYSRAVMLEAPTLALCVAAIFYFQRALANKGDRRARYLCALFTAAAFLTKQNAFFLILVFGSYALLSGNISRLARRVWITPLVIVLALAVPYYVVAMKIYGETLVKDAVGVEQTAPGGWLWYYYTLPKQLGSMWNSGSLIAQVIAHLAVLATAVVAVGAIVRRKAQPYLLYLCWIFSCYIFFTPMAQKDSRHMILWVPPLCVMSAVAIAWAGRTISRLARNVNAGGAFAAATVLAICIYTAYDTMSQRPYVRGYEAAARYAVQVQEKGTVFFKGELNGNFVFFPRINDPSRTITTSHSIAMCFIEEHRRADLLRAFFVSNASHDLFSARTMAKYGQVEHIASEEELRDLLKRRGVRYMVVEEPDIFDDSASIAALRILSDFLKSPMCTLEREFPVESNVPKYRGVVLKVYRFEPEK
jgi:hypothetical protein